VEGGGGGLTVSGVSRNRGSFVKCVAIQKRLGTPALGSRERTHSHGGLTHFATLYVSIPVVFYLNFSITHNCHLHNSVSYYGNIFQRALRHL
jgi:hypothetical protein